VTQIASDDAQSLLRAGAAALARGEAVHARESFARCTAMDAANVAAWLGRARADAALGDDHAALAAIDAALAREPRNWQALVMKADCFLRRGDERAAATFYAAGVRQAPATPDGAALRELERASAMCVAIADKFRRHLDERLREAGYDETRSSRRFVQSLSLLGSAGRPAHLQRAKIYFLPGLPARRFYEREEFAWVPQLEAATGAIREELRALLQTQDSFAPYVQRVDTRPTMDGRGLIDNPGWSACYLIRSGVRVPEMVAACPAAFAAMAQVPLDHVAGRAPSVLFSLLQPGMRIPPHHGFVNTRLIGHLPLIAPPHCALRVGGEARAWREGEALIFDDSIEHEAWNESDRLRVVLLFDFWRPELTAEEQNLVSALFRAIDEYGGGSGEWT